MDDLISRQAAIDALMHTQEVYSNNFGNDPIDKYTIALIANDIETIVKLPSAQPEQIRCKDCKYFLKSNEKCELIDTRLYFYGTGKTWTDDCFCAWAERRE